jgi:PAS domain S-box-containing protein
MTTPRADMDGAPAKAPTILIVDDTAANVAVLADHLGDHGFAVLVAQDGEEGIERARYGRPDLILLDVMMPGMGGFDTCTRLKADEATRDIPVIFMTALSDIGDKITGYKVGGVDYVTKPFHTEEVLARVNTHLAMQAMQRQLQEQNHSLQLARDHLRTAHGQLELRVAERTAELARTVDALHAQIIECKHTEELLRRREQEFRTLAENSPDMVIRYGRDGRRFYVNPAYEKETGIPAGEALQKAPEGRWRIDMPVEEYRDELQRVMDSGLAREVYLHAPGPDGKEADYAFHLVAERSPEGEVVGALAIGRNITTLKETGRKLEASQKLLRQLAVRGEAVREAERKSLTREIHDEMGQYLSALRLGVSLIGLQFGPGQPELEERTRKLVDLVDATIKVVRNVVASLRPAALDMGIVSALEWLVDEFVERHGIACTLEVDEDFTLDEKRAVEVFRIVQESLTNVARHAQASEVRISIERNDAFFLLEVRDNGKGFEPGKRKQKSFGLVGIRERVLVLNGKLEICSEPGRGTAIKLCCPIAEAGAEP